VSAGVVRGTLPMMIGDRRPKSRKVSPSEYADDRDDEQADGKERYNERWGVVQGEVVARVGVPVVAAAGAASSTSTSGCGNRRGRKSGGARRDQRVRRLNGGGSHGAIPFLYELTGTVR